MNYLTTLIAISCIAAGCANSPDKNTEPVTETTIKSNADTALTQSHAEDVDAATFLSLLESGQGLLLDVRTPEEFEAGHIDGAKNLNYNDRSFSEALDTFNKAVPVYVYCQAGGRSGKAKELMQQKGFSEVYNLVGGFGNWPY